MTEFEAKQIIENDVKGLLGQDDSVALVSRKSLSRHKHQAVYAVVFKHNEATEASVVGAIKKLSFSSPNLMFEGTEVNDKFKMEFVAVLVSATIKG